MGLGRKRKNARPGSRRGAPKRKRTRVRLTELTPEQRAAMKNHDWLMGEDTPTRHGSGTVQVSNMVGRSPEYRRAWNYYPKSTDTIN